MPQFVILRHETVPGCPQESHWDLMLEWGGGLKTWSFTSWPTPTVAIDAVAKPDHRLAYLTYEGEVSRNRGSVRRVVAGNYTEIACDTDHWEVFLHSSSLTGRCVIRRIGAARWELLLLA